MTDIADMSIEQLAAKISTVGCRPEYAIPGRGLVTRAGLLQWLVAVERARPPLWRPFARRRWSRYMRELRRLL